MNAGEGLSVTEKYVESTSLDLFLSGSRSAQNWNAAAAPTDFFYSKSAVEMILTRLGVSADSVMNGESKRKYYTESFTWARGRKLIAETGRLSAAILKEFDIEQDVYYTHIDWNNLLELLHNNSIRFRELPKYPVVRRDLALLLDRNVTFSQIRDLAFRTEKNIIREVGLFDVYTGEQIGKDKKSYAVSFILRDDMKTLTDTGIEKIMNNLINTFKKELGAQIR
jgi:phenylalanyl-tRNA synthetase beta chain